MQDSDEDREIERRAKELAERTGVTMAKAATIIRQRQEAKSHVANVRDELVAIGRRCAARPDLDRRRSDEILGYDEIGLPS